MSISLQTRSGHLNASAIVGMAVFTQFWNWFPLTYFISLALCPTAIVAIDREMKVYL